MYVSLSACTLGKDLELRSCADRRLLVKEPIAKISKLRNPLMGFLFVLGLGVKKLIPRDNNFCLGMVELAGEGLWLWLLALVAGDRLQVKGDR